MSHIARDPSNEPVQTCTPSAITHMLFTAAYVCPLLIISHRDGERGKEREGVRGGRWIERGEVSRGEGERGDRLTREPS